MHYQKYECLDQVYSIHYDMWKKEFLRYSVLQGNTKEFWRYSVLQGNTKEFLRYSVLQGNTKEFLKYSVLQGNTKEFLRYSVLQRNTRKTLSIFENFLCAEVSYEYVMVARLKNGCSVLTHLLCNKHWSQFLIQLIRRGALNGSCYR